MRVVLVLLLVLSLSVSGAFQEVKPSVLRFEPAPAEQGRTVDVWLQFSNSGTQADRVKVRFEPEFPFNLPIGQAESVDVGLIAASQSKVQKFTLYVDPSTPNGEYFASFWYQFGGSSDWIQFDAPISVSSQSAVLLVEDYSVEPSPVVPGQRAKIVLGLRNAGRVGVKNLDVSFVSDDFTPVGSGSKKRIDFVGSGERVVVSFDVASDTDAAVKRYTLPVNLSYSDERGNVYSDVARVSVVVSDVPELSVVVDSTDFVDRSSAGSVSLKVVNRGVVDAKFATLRLIDTDEYDVLSSTNEAYIGNLDSDDFDSVDFTIKPLVDSPRLSVVLDFKDPYNVGFVRQFDLPLRIVTDKDLGKGGVGFSWIVLLFVVGVIWYYFRRKKFKR